MASPLHRKPAAQRIKEALGFVGQMATVTIDMHRDGTSLIPVHGRVLSVSRSWSGTAAVVVVRTGKHQVDDAISLAIVRSIKAEPQTTKEVS